MPPIRHARLRRDRHAICHFLATPVLYLPAPICSPGAAQEVEHEIRDRARGCDAPRPPRALHFHGPQHPPQLCALALRKPAARQGERGRRVATARPDPLCQHRLGAQDGGSRAAGGLCAPGRARSRGHPPRRDGVHPALLSLHLSNRMPDMDQPFTMLHMALDPSR